MMTPGDIVTVDFPGVRGIKRRPQEQANLNHQAPYTQISLSNHAIIVVVLTNPIPVYGIALQDAQSSVVTPDANRYFVPYTFKAQPW